MRYSNKTFSVNVGGQAYSDGWERTFGQVETPLPPAPAPQAPPSFAPRAPYTLRCASCGHSTIVHQASDVASHRSHACSQGKSVIASARNEIQAAISAGLASIAPGVLQAALHSGAADF